jgi:hypothetical protein
MTVRAALVAAALVTAGTARAANDPNEVGALLVYPAIFALGGEYTGEYEIEFEGDGPQLAVAGQVETLLTLTNAGPNPVLAHFYYVNGDAAAQTAAYCSECDFQIPLTGNDTETLAIRQVGGGIAIESEDSDFAMSCPFSMGMIVVTQEDGSMAPWNTLTDNVLLGEQVVIDYLSGSAFSLPALPFQGGTPDEDFRNYAFDDQEYAKLPRIVAADFLAPTTSAGTRAQLALFTLGFERLFPPLVDCSVTGFDAHENPFSASFQFGCWTLVDLCEISPEFCHPNLGLLGDPLAGADTHGWLQLNCRVDADPGLANGFDATGGVHGALIQYQQGWSTLPAGSGAALGGSAAWGRLLYQSVTTGDAVTLQMQAHPFL